jgi:photosystem II stability/assembly factor-like uncharacterized protein
MFPNFFLFIDMKISNRKQFLLLCILALGASTTAYAQKVNPALFNCMKWRMIGPFRGGRTVGASGNRLQPNVFYMGVNNGGVWKTTDYGRTWNSIFDDQPTGSIGDVAVAPSDPNIVYVASGEGLQRPDLSTGDGMYRSNDGGKTWAHIGLSEGLQIGGISVDPQNPDRVFAAVLGHPYGPNKERGVYRTIDGGKTWKNVLYIDENTGAIQVTIDPKDNNIVYAELWAARLAPWENGEWQGPGSGLYKSTDGGNTWKQLKKGLPTTDSGLGRIGFCIAPSNHNRLYATVNANDRNGGLYRSDDAGESWRKMSGDSRLWERGNDFAEVKVDPKNEDIVYDANVVVWKSTDGGKTWKGFKGAPGGDDYHRLWINPDNTDVILLASDQGAGITTNGGKTWSSWYNQPTAQLYHVSADNAFPYNLYSGQQESGSVGISSRGNDGAITFRDWHPVYAEEYGYVVADPLDPNIIYGGKISRYDKRTGQSVNIAPEVLRSGKYRFIRTAPIVFSPVDNKSLFYAGNVLFRTRNGGNAWDVISPDLTRTTYDVAECIGVYRKDEMKTMPRRGVIYTIAPSPLDSNIIWVGTDDGLIHVTHDGGKNWENVTPPGITSWSKISLMDASHFDANKAYAAVNRIRLDDLHPHIYKTTDGGKTWKEIVNGLADDPINVVKEDPFQRGLLFAGSERAVQVSFDDGANWQPLRLNMPATSIRDLCIKINDIAIATHGRSFWILDDITPLRQIAKGNATKDVVLYKPQAACRVRWSLNTDTPLPQDEPAGENPPDGAIIDYYLKENAKGEVTMDIIDINEKVITHYSSKDTLYSIPDVNIPLYWVRPQQVLSGKAGSHRFLWDMHYQPLNVPPSFSMSAIYEDTPPAYTSPWVMPGSYAVRLMVNGKEYAHALNIYMDPRIKTSFADLKQQHDLSYQCYADQLKCLEATKKLTVISLQLKALSAKDKEHPASLASFSETVNELLSPARKPGAASFVSVNGALANVLGNLQGADEAPTSQCRSAATTAHQDFENTWNKWQEIQNKITEINKELKKVGLPVIEY